jgi:hypothetical protein
MRQAHPGSRPSWAYIRLILTKSAVCGANFKLVQNGSGHAESMRTVNTARIQARKNTEMTRPRSHLSRACVGPILTESAVCGADPELVRNGLGHAESMKTVNTARIQARNNIEMTRPRSCPSRACVGPIPNMLAMCWANAELVSNGSGQFILLEIIER